MMMKRLLLLSFALSASTPAFAEVCDKYSESWRPADGPIDTWTFANSWPVLALAGALAAAALLFRSRGLALGCGALFAVPFLGNLFFWLRPERPADNEVLASAIREGCMSGNPTNNLIGVIIYGLLIVAFFLMSRRQLGLGKGLPS